MNCQTYSQSLYYVVGYVLWMLFGSLLCSFKYMMKHFNTRTINGCHPFPRPIWDLHVSQPFKYKLPKWTLWKICSHWPITDFNCQHGLIATKRCWNKAKQTFIKILRLAGPKEGVGNEKTLPLPDRAGKRFYLTSVPTPNKKENYH